MDVHAVDHSDSDSGESWTLLEHNPAYGEDNPSFERGNTAAGLEKDEDTDGISIISDSDPESTLCDLTCDKCSSVENQPSKPGGISCNQNNPQSPENKNTIQSLCNEDDFVGDNTIKLKTYVHKRNKKLGIVLNVIMLGSIITAAGVAIGHMWGARNECGVPAPSVNKILSNLYKLQEENAYLRRRVKELTLGNIQPAQQQKSEMKQIKPQRCKKMFEESLSTKKMGKGIKCVDQDSNKYEKLDTPGQIPSHEKEFISDLDKMKKIYNQNKGWLDKHIQRNLKNVNKSNKCNIMDQEVSGKETKYYKVFNLNSTVLRKFTLPDVDEHDENDTPSKQSFRIPESDETARPNKVWNLGKLHIAANKVDRLPEIDRDTKSEKIPCNVISLEKQIKSTIKNEPIELSDNFEHLSHEVITSTNEDEDKEQKISYADSLKVESNRIKSQMNDSNRQPVRGERIYAQKRKRGGDDILNIKSFSEEEIKKDDRYTRPQIKKDKKKNDRHKIHKKQKRKNKYEQWEMKGGYMKDFDEFSMTSSQFDLAKDVAPEIKHQNHDVDADTDAVEIIKPKKSEDASKADRKGDKGGKKVKDSEWYNKRHALRAEARRKLEQELFGESSLNNAAWYFRRMNKREQCRAQKDNTTFKRFSKQKMNYKMKH